MNKIQYLIETCKLIILLASELSSLFDDQNTRKRKFLELHSFSIAYLNIFKTYLKISSYTLEFVFTKQKSIPVVSKIFHTLKNQSSFKYFRD